MSFFCDHEWKSTSRQITKNLWGDRASRATHTCEKCGKTQDCDKGPNYDLPHGSDPVTYSYKCTICGQSHDGD